MSTNYLTFRTHLNQNGGKNLSSNCRDEMVESQNRAWHTSNTSVTSKWRNVVVPLMISSPVNVTIAFGLIPFIVPVHCISSVTAYSTSENDDDFEKCKMRKHTPRSLTQDVCKRLSTGDNVFSAAIDPQ